MVKTRGEVSAIHEDLRRKVEVRRASDRSLGLTIGAALLVVALLPLLPGGAV